MTESYVRHLFPGGNTPNGFYSFYDYIISNPCRLIILKGGPGVGKSTFMRKIGIELSKRGYLVEFHHCSSYNSSLDGVVIPKLGIALIDGTAPHVVDPKHPGCVDEILHLGDYWNEDYLVENRQQILALTSQIKDCFSHAYRLLHAAKSLYDDWEAVNIAALDHHLANKNVCTVLNTIFPNRLVLNKSAKLRKLFASAITPDGPLNHFASIIDPMPQKIVIAGDPGTGKSTLLKKVVDMVLLTGYDVESFYCPLDPTKIEHAIIPELGLAITTKIDCHNYMPQHPLLTIDMNECLKPALIKSSEDIVTYDKKMFTILLSRAVNHLHQAKKVHDDMEQYYIPAMNFKQIDQIWQYTVERILKYASG